MILSDDPGKLAYDILSSTPAGGLLNLFYNPLAFSIGITIASWTQSGTYFMLVSLWAHMTKRVNENKILSFFETLFFTFAIGVISSVISSLAVDFGELLFDNFVSGNFSVKFVCVMLNVVYYMIALVLLIVTVVFFLDTLRMLGTMLRIAGPLLIVINLISLYFGSFNRDHSTLFFTIVDGINYAAFELPKIHSFLSQLIMTILVNTIYSIGLMGQTIYDEAVPKREERQQLKECEKIVAAGNRARKIESMSAIKRFIYKRQEPEEYALYEEDIKKYGGSYALHRAAREANDKKEQLEDEIREETERIQSLDETYFGTKENAEDDRKLELICTEQEKCSLIKSDGDKNLYTHLQQSMYQMESNEFCSKYKLDMLTIKNMSEKFAETNFLQERLSFRMNYNSYSKFVGSVAFDFSVFSYIVVRILTILALFGYDLAIVVTVFSYIAGAGLWFVLLDFIISPFKRTVKSEGMTVGYIIFAAALLFSALMCTETADLVINETGFGQSLLMILNVIGVYAFINALLELKIIRRQFLKKRFIRRPALKHLYKYRSQRDGADQETFALMLCCYVRYEELNGYFSGSVSGTLGDSADLNYNLFDALKNKSEL